MNAEELNRISAGDWSTLDELLAQLKAELRASRAMPIRRLRLKDVLEAPDDRLEIHLGSWKGPRHKDGRAVLVGATGGNRPGSRWSPFHTSDDDGSALTVWARPRAVRRNADAIHPANDKLEDLDHDTQKRGCEAAGEEGKVRRLHLSFPVTFSYFLLKN